MECRWPAAGVGRGRWRGAGLGSRPRRVGALRTPVEAIGDFRAGVEPRRPPPDRGDFPDGPCLGCRAPARGAQRSARRPDPPQLLPRPGPLHRVESGWPADRRRIGRDHIGLGLVHGRAETDAACRHGRRPGAGVEPGRLATAGVLRRRHGGRARPREKSGGAAARRPCQGRTQRHLESGRAPDRLGELRQHGKDLGCRNRQGAAHAPRPHRLGARHGLEPRLRARGHRKQGSDDPDLERRRRPGDSHHPPAGPRLPAELAPSGPVAGRRVRGGHSLGLRPRHGE